MRWERCDTRDVCGWGDETIGRGELLCLKDRIAESGRIYCDHQCKCYFYPFAVFTHPRSKFRRHCFDDSIYTVIAGTQFRVAMSDHILRPESPFPALQYFAIIAANAIFTPLHWLFCNNRIYRIYTRSIIAGVARTLSVEHRGGSILLKLLCLLLAWGASLTFLFLSPACLGSLLPNSVLAERQIPNQRQSATGCSIALQSSEAKPNEQTPLSRTTSVCE